MSLALDPATEQRIQREIARGPSREPAELINRALDLLESQENWLLRNKDAINERLEESMAQAERGEVYTPEEVRDLLNQDRQSRANRQQCAATAWLISPREICAIVAYLAEQASEAVALRIEDELFAKFDSLADHPGQAHRRSDLTPLPLVFFTVDPCLIVYQRDISPIVVHAIFQGARDVKRHLERRPI
jgi:plasmid stabilization system protein ParE/Arc/MetJ-type ribon-helix-helix transcriptional regulator